MDKMFMILLLAAIFIGYYWYQNKLMENENIRSSDRYQRKNKHRKYNRKVETETDISLSEMSDISEASIKSEDSKESIELGSMGSDLSISSSIVNGEDSEKSDDSEN